MTGSLLARVPLLAKWSGRMIQIKTAHEIELMRAAGLVVAGALAAVRAEGRRRMSAGILTRMPLVAKWSGRMIQIKTAQEIELMRGAGLVVAGAIAAVRAAVRPGVTTGELDAIAEDHIRTAGAVPSFLGYHGFTGSICASINNEIVHGIPDPERALAEGDNISIDCGAILRGWHGDSAVTVTVGEPSLVTTVQPSSSSTVAGSPTVTIGSIASARPGTSLGPRPGRP